MHCLLQSQLDNCSGFPYKKGALLSTITEYNGDAIDPYGQMCNFQLHCIFFQGRYQTRKALSGGRWRDGLQWNVQRGLSDTFVECSCLENKGRYLWQCAWSWILSTMINRIFSVISDFHNEMCYKVSIDKCVSSDTGSAWPARGFVISLLAIQRKKCISLVSLCKNHPFPY